MGSDDMKHTLVTFIIYLLIATGISIATYYAVPSLAEQGISSLFISAVFSTVTLLGAAWYFLTSLKAFKSTLKIAYYLLVAGIVIYNLVLAQFFLVIFVDLGVFWGNALFLIPYALTSLLAYLAMRKFAKLLEIKNLWTSILFIFMVAVVVAFIATLAPHSPALTTPETGLDEQTVDAVIGVLTWASFFGISAGIVTLRVRHVINKTLKKPMLWMALALFSFAFSALHELTTKIFFFDSGYTGSDISFWPFIVADILFLRAGIAFKAAHRQVLRLPAKASYIDIVTAMAGLVSKPGVVDAELDKLRDITAASSDPQGLSEKDKATLRQLYLYLEDYLVTKEPLSKFNREDLREALPKEFANKLS